MAQDPPLPGDGEDASGDAYQNRLKQALNSLKLEKQKRLYPHKIQAPNPENPAGEIIQIGVFSDGSFIGTDLQQWFGCGLNAHGQLGKMGLFLSGDQHNLDEMRRK